MARKNWNNLVNDFVSAWGQYFNTMGIKKENIIIDDIYRLSDKTSKSRSLQKQSGLNMSDLEDDVSQVVQHMVSVYDETIRDKEIMLDKARDLYETTFVQTMVDVSLDDGFNNFKEDEDYVIAYEPEPDEVETLGEKFIEEVQDDIDDFVEKSGVKDIVADTIPETIRDGEHALALRIEQGKGVTGISDDIDVKSILPFYRGNKLAFVMEKTVEKKSFSEQEKLRFYRPDNIVFFRLNHFNKKRVELTCLDKKARDTFKEKLKLDVPKYARICLPLYYAALEDIDTLRTMEKLSKAQDFVNLLRSPIIGLGVPANTTSEDAKKAMREYERHLNDVKNVLGSFQDMSVDELIGLASERKLLPLFGDNKGSLTTMDLSDANKVADSRDAVANQRKMAALTVGYPAFYFTDTEAPQDKSMAIKLFSRFTKKLTGLQVCAAEGTGDIIYAHLKAKGKNIKRSNIKVKFKSLTNGDILDEVDVMVATVTGLADMYDALEKIASSESNMLVIDSDKLQGVWDIYTSNLANISGLLKKDPNKFDMSDEDFGDMDGLDRGGFPSSRRSMERPQGIEPPTEEPETESPELSPEQEQQIDRANAESEADFVNSTSAELT